MMTVTRVLVPVDFSEHSKRALDCAKTMAEKFNASLHLLTVVPDRTDEYRSRTTSG